MLTFRLPYFVLAFLLFTIEVIIAIFFKDGFIRPLFGDFLVVILMYTALMSILKANKIKVAIGVLLFSYLIEVLQYFEFVKVLGLNDYPLARIIMGTTFSWGDILAYTLGIAVVFLVEKKRKNGKV